MPRKGTLPAGISEESLRGAPSLATALKQVGKCKAVFAAGPSIVNTGSHLSMLYYTRAHMRSDYIVGQRKFSPISPSAHISESFIRDLFSPVLMIA